jgi:hypothetical protein
MTFIALDICGVLSRGLERAGWDVTALWLASVALGGNVSQTQIREALVGRELPQGQYNILALALNEHVGNPDDSVHYLD